MEVDRYLDIGYRYHTLANTGFNFFSVYSIALVGWIVTVATAESFQPASWERLRWWIAGLYLGATLVSAAALFIAGLRANAALRIARAKLSRVEDDALLADVKRLTLPFQSGLIIVGMLSAAGLISAGVVFLLGPSGSDP